VRTTLRVRQLSTGRENRSAAGACMIAQHGGEAGVLGKRGIKNRSPSGTRPFLADTAGHGDYVPLLRFRGLSQVLSLAQVGLRESRVVPWGLLCSFPLYPALRLRLRAGLSCTRLRRSPSRLEQPSHLEEELVMSAVAVGIRGFHRTEDCLHDKANRGVGRKAGRLGERRRRL